MSITTKWGTYSPNSQVRALIALHKLSFLGNTLKRPIRRLVLLRSEIFDVQLNNLKFRCFVRDNATERDIVLGGQNVNVHQIAQAISCLPIGGTFLDVGANCGLFALAAAARVGPAGRVVAIEPNPIMLDRLAFNIAENKFENITVVPFAVGDHEGTAELQVITKQMGRSTFVSRSSDTTIATRVLKLSQVLDQAGVTSIDAMKIDVEGYEDRVIVPLLEEGRREAWPKRIMMETVHSAFWQSDCIQRLLDAGYRITWKGKFDVVLELQ
jgi:FkbM family methyltransferase